MQDVQQAVRDAAHITLNMHPPSGYLHAFKQGIFIVKTSDPSVMTY